MNEITKGGGGGGGGGGRRRKSRERGRTDNGRIIYVSMVSV